jgi:hypothetical protein
VYKHAYTDVKEAKVKIAIKQLPFCKFRFSN